MGRWGETRRRLVALGADHGQRELLHRSVQQHRREPVRDTRFVAASNKAEPRSSRTATAPLRRSSPANSSAVT
jgi:hypothetical protein